MSKVKKPSRYVPEHLRQRVFQRDGYKCLLLGVPAVKPRLASYLNEAESLLIFSLQPEGEIFIIKPARLRGMDCI